MSEKIDLDKIEAAAKRATPGPWRSITNDSGHVIGIDGPIDPRGWQNRIVDLYEGPELNDMAFMAACSPDVVLALVRRIRELEQRARVVEPVYLAAKALHQLSDVIDDGSPLMVHHPLQRALVEALNESYGKL